LPKFFYDLQLWQATVLILGISLFVGLGSSLGIRKLFRLSPTEEETEIAINLMQVASAYIGIMLAFAGVLVWQDYEDAEVAVHQEAAAASELYRDMSIYGDESIGIRQQIRVYVDSIVHDEWPLLSVGGRSNKTEENLERLFEAYGKVKPQDDRQSAIYQEAFGKLNELIGLRRDRITASQTDIPAVLWIVGVLGSVLTIAYASAFSNSRYTSLMISGISLTIGLLFLFLLSVDNPFKGHSALNGHQLSELDTTFDRIDRMH
jgi:hypothetical protein